jgi:hypothetical protein
MLRSISPRFPRFSESGDNLEPPAIGVPDRVVASVPHRREFDAQQPGGVVLGDLASHAKGLSRQRAVFLRQPFRCR